MLRDYAAPGLQKPTIEKKAIAEIQNLMRQKRLVVILLSEANLLDRSHNESQRLGAYRTLFYTTQGWQFKVGLLSTEADTRSAIGLSFQHSGINDGPISAPTDDQVDEILQAAGPHPGQIDQAVASLGSHVDGTTLAQHLVDKLLQANKAVYEAIWNGLQQRERAVILTYSLMKRGELSRADAQTTLERQTEDFYATDTDFRDVERKRGDPWSRVGQCLLPWRTKDKCDFFCEAFAVFVEQKLPQVSSVESAPTWRTHVRTPLFLFLTIFASMVVGLVMFLLTMVFHLPRLLAVFAPLLLIGLYFVIFLCSHAPALKWRIHKQ